MDQFNLIQNLTILLLPLLFAITLHEVAHGWMALRCGDTTAWSEGRLSLNPLRHVDPVGTVLVPAILYFLGGFIFGWAKPVPVNYYRLRHPKQDMALVALAGPGANLAMAIGWALVMLLGKWIYLGVPWLGIPLYAMGFAGIQINIVIGVLNMLPIPPLDGSRVLTGLMPDGFGRLMSQLEPFGMVILLLLLTTGLLNIILGLPIYWLQRLIFLISGIEERLSTMHKETILTGITTTGTPHLGNYVGAIQPAIAASRRDDVKTYYFLADFHSLVKCQDPELVQRSTLEVAATWLAAGLDTEQSVFYRQSDIPEITELTWILTCMAAKGLMNRAHAYKAAVDENVKSQETDPDKGITMGLFCYPILMAADILMFNANKVPVGKDQVQHLEMTRDIATRFNYHYGEHFVLPEAVVDEAAAVLVGLDGRKMSKSYKNTIPLFTPPDQLRKLIMKIKTNSQPPGEPKDPDNCTLFAIYQAFANEHEVSAMRKRYAEGIGWGEMKQTLFEYLNDYLTTPRERYEALLRAPDHIEQVLRGGAAKAREYSVPLLQRIRQAVGIRPIGS